MRALTERRSGLEVRLFGPPEIYLYGQPVTRLPAKTVALLIYLAVTGEAHPRSTLAALLWGEVSQKRARANLRKGIQQLRSKLPQFMAIERGYLALRKDRPVWIDVDEFERIVDAAQVDADGSVLDDALRLYRDDFLKGFDVRHAPDFDAWRFALRVRLREEMIDVLVRLSQHALAVSNLQQAIAVNRRIIELEPWREETHRMLIKLLAEDGQRGAALAQFETCRDALAEELDVEPGVETVALVERIRAGDSRQTNEVPVMPESPRHNLPAQSTPFVGREDELTELDRLLDDPDTRLVTILAPGGMGKTRLAIEAAARNKGNYRDGVYFVALAPLSEPEAMVATVASSVGYTFQSERRTPRQQVLDYLHARSMLLVLDNAEHLLAGVDLLTALLESGSGVRLLVTSRERLRLSGESILDLGGLSLEGIEVGAMSAAARLFVQSAQRVRPSLEPTQENWPDILRICQLVQGMPLGLVLAASWIEMLSVDEIAGEIERSFDFLAADLRDLPERQRSLRAVFESTYQRLTEREASAFRRLSIFRGGFTRQAADEVAGASLATLAKLSHKSLIRRNLDSRYEVHELLRQFSVEVLAGEEANVRNAHSTYFCSRLQDWYGELIGKQQQTAMREIEADAENIRLAWRWALEQDQLEQLAQALDGLCLAWLWQSQPNEGEAFCQMILERLQTCDQERAFDSIFCARLRVRTLIWAGAFQRVLFQFDEASERLEQAAALFNRMPLDAVETHWEEALMLLEQAEVADHTGDHVGIDLSKQSVALLRKLDAPWHLARALDAKGNLLRNVGQFEPARKAHEEGLALRQAFGDERGIASSLRTLGAIARVGGRFEESEAALRHSITNFRKLNDGRQEAMSLGSLATTLTVGGLYAEGQRTFEATAVLRSNLGLPRNTNDLVVRGYGLMLMGHYERARQLLEEALTIHAEGSHTSLTGWVYANLGRIAMVEKEYDTARQLLQQGIAIFRHQHQNTGLGSTLANLGIATIQVGYLTEARTYIEEGLQIAANTRLFLPTITSLSSTALLKAHQGNIESAVELYALASQHKHVANSDWYSTMIGRPIAVAASDLPPKMVEAARAKGRQRDREETIAELAAAVGRLHSSD